MPRRSGYAITELVVVLVMIAIMAALALPKISFTRYRQDANARLVQSSVITAQQLAIRNNTNVLMVFDFSQSRMRVVQDTNANGAVDSSEPMKSQALAEGAKFAIPTTTIDGATAYYATGAGISTTTNGPTITFYPSGSASGNAYIYLGVRSGDVNALRAVEFEGATTRTRVWRYRGGAWRRDST